MPTPAPFLEAFVPTATRLPVIIDHDSGEPIAEVVIKGTRPVITGFDLSEWLRPPKLYFGLALLVGVVYILSDRSRR